MTATADVGSDDREVKRKTARGARSVKDMATAAVTPENIIDLIGRLGLVDVFVSKLRTRLENADVDQLIDDAYDYLRRNPEVLVALLAMTTMAAGLVMFLQTRIAEREARNDYDDDDYEMPRQRAGAKKSRRA